MISGQESEVNPSIRARNAEKIQLETEWQHGRPNRLKQRAEKPRLDDQETQAINDWFWKVMDYVLKYFK